MPSKSTCILTKSAKTWSWKPHRKFRRATAWVSDDSNRLPLRIEAQIFVGTVFAELQSVQFETEKPYFFFFFFFFFFFTVGAGPKTRKIDIYC